MDTSERHTPNDEYENFHATHMKAAAKCISTKPRAKYRVPKKITAVRENEITWKKSIKVTKQMSKPRENWLTHTKKNDYNTLKAKSIHSDTQ